jgi:hypothetical protein
MNLDWAMPWLKRWSLTAEARVRARVSVGFVVDKVALGQVFLSSLVFPVSIVTYSGVLFHDGTLLNYKKSIHYS